MVKGHGGDIYRLSEKLGCNTSDIIDMSSNLNPAGPIPGLIEFLKENISSILSLPQADANKMIESFAIQNNIDKDCVLAGSGTTQFIYSIPVAFNIKHAIIFGPTYSDYADACTMHKKKFSFFYAKKQDGFVYDMKKAEKKLYNADTVFICNPNNPTGVLIIHNELISFISKHKNHFFIIDESYMPFVNNYKNESIINNLPENAVVLCSMSKMFRVPGLRIGFIIGNKKHIEKLKEYQIPWSVNSMAQTAANYLISANNEVEKFIISSQKTIREERLWFKNKLEKKLSLELFPSKTSFILAHLKNRSAYEICGALSQHKILIRDCTNFSGLSKNFIRFSLKLRKENKKLIDNLLPLLN